MLPEPNIYVFKQSSGKINSTQIIKMLFSRCLVNLIITFLRRIFCKNIIIFRHLELEIALAILAPNE